MKIKHLLLGGVSALTAGMLLAPAFAEEGVETVVVTGMRASLQSSQAIKQNSDQVLDSITAVDIGALPDRNVAEALQRVPGVTLQRNSSPNDLTRMGSTGNSVFVRGLAWIQSTMNGRDEFSAVNGRTLSFADVSADLLSGVDVYKSPTASMIEGGIGGVVDLKTRKPFDQDGQKIAISGDYTYGDLSKQALPSGNALYSNRWNTAVGEFGILASVDWQDEHNRTSGFNLGTYDCWVSGSSSNYAMTDNGYDTCMSGSHFMAPQSWAWRQMEFTQQRLAANVVVQWRPSEQWEVTLSAMNSYAHSQDIEHYVDMTMDDYDKYMKTATFDVDGNWLGGQSALSNFDVRAGTGHNRTSDLNLNVKWNPNDNLEISADFQFVESDHQYKNNTVLTGYTGTLNMGIDVSGDNPAVDWTDDGETEKASNYQWTADMDHMEYNAAHAYAGRLDAVYKFDGNGLFGYFKSLRTGFRTEQKLAVVRSTGYNWVALCPKNWGAPRDGCPTLDGTVSKSYTAVDGTTVTSDADAVKEITGQATLFKYRNVLGNAMPSLYVASPKLATMNLTALNTLFNSVMPDNTGWNWISYASAAGCTGSDVTCLAAYANTSKGYNVSDNRITPQKQRTYAAYLQADFGHETFFGYDLPFDGNAGVRFVRTGNVTSADKMTLPALNGSLTSCWIGREMKAGDATTAIASCDNFNTALAFWGTNPDGTPKSAGMTIARPGSKTHYTDILPSFNFRSHLTDDLQMRLGYSETMLRPDFDWTRNNASLSFNWDDQQTSKAFMFKNDPAGSGGNPQLKPMHSVNYDVSLEWYFSPGGSITLSAFDKKINNYIYTASATKYIENPYNNNATMAFDYTTYVNGDKGGVSGWELAYQQFYDMLPGFWGGFGIEANYTKIYNWGGHNGAVDTGSALAIAFANDKSLPMEGMSHDSYNLALLYAKYNIDARLAWNWRSAYLSSSSDANAKQPSWIENYGQLDASIFYTLLDHYKVGVQATNITGANFYTDIGTTSYHPRLNSIKTDRKFSVVLRANW